jgi:hypothetical protein
MTHTTIQLESNSGIITIFYHQEKAGFIEFTIKDNTLDIFHTEVDSAFGGKGLGKELVQACVDYAKENNLKITATCPYANSVLRKL